ncbi:hypothetical protein IC762_17105 [Bradyrhizobium genosp. L]|uniref:hypothetical protein n=1 Tax=Bradyrhizobium genosp. L TaxID=83637 RepID=UPI0018A2FE4F|nr:hypothetical protein [Bradyrhizobium genosp. L]QPF87904.1 hypothetical protein IC762_17105 [Bradyrhizobium genosp. L]
MPIDRMMRGLVGAALLASMAALGGCSSTVADMTLPADAPARAKDPSGYLPVHDLPPDRTEQTMKPADQAKLEQELIAARDHQAQESGATQNTSGK